MLKTQLKSTHVCYRVVGSVAARKNPPTCARTIPTNAWTFKRAAATSVVPPRVAEFAMNLPYLAHSERPARQHRSEIAGFSRPAVLALTDGSNRLFSLSYRDPLRATGGSRSMSCDKGADLCAASWLGIFFGSSLTAQGYFSDVLLSNPAPAAVHRQYLVARGGTTSSTPATSAAAIVVTIFAACSFPRSASGPPFPWPCHSCPSKPLPDEIGARGTCERDALVDCSCCFYEGAAGASGRRSLQILLALGSTTCECI